MYRAATHRYDAMPYRAVGKSGLKLPAISLGLWHNFGDATPMAAQRAMLRTAFDLGITHFDLANNYGPPYDSAESNFGEHLRRDFRPYRDELIISSKAGYDMWPGPYGQGGGSRKTCWPVWTKASSAWGWSTSIFFTRTGLTPTPRWKKPWAPWPQPYNRAKRCM